MCRGDTVVKDPTSIGGRSDFFRQIHRPSRSDRAPSSFGGVILQSVIQLLSGDDRVFNYQIHRPGRSDMAPSSFGGVIRLSAIQLLSGDDQAFAIRSTASIRVIGHLPLVEERYCHQRSNFYWETIGLLPLDPSPWTDRAPSLSREVILPSAIQLLSSDNWAFAGSDRATSSFVGVILPSAIQLLSRDDQAFAVRSTALVEAIRYLHRLKGDTAVSDPTSIGGRSSFYLQIHRSTHRPGRSDQLPSSFGAVILPSAFQLLSGDNRTFVVRSTTLIHHPDRSNRAPSSFGEVILPSAIQLLSRDVLPSDPPPWGRSGFYRQIHRPGRSDRAPSSFGGMILPSEFQLLSGDDRAFVLRSTVLVEAIGHLRRLERYPTAISGRLGFCRQIHRHGRSDRAPSLFGKVILPAAIQLLSGDDQAFALRSTTLIHHLGRSDRASSSFGKVIQPSAIQLLSEDDRAFAIKSTALIAAIGCDTTVSDPTFIGRRLGFCRQIHRPCRSDWTPSSFGEVILPSAIQLLYGERFAVKPTALVGAIGHLRRLERSDRVPSSFGEVIRLLAVQLLPGDDRAFVVRSTANIHRPGWSYRAPSSFGEVILPSAIQLLSGNDRTFAVRSTAQIHRPGRSDRTPSSFLEVILPSTIQLISGDDQAFVVRSTVLILYPSRSDRAPSSFGGVILPSAIQLLSGTDQAFTVRSIVLERSDTFVVWRGDIAVNDPTSIDGRSGFSRQIHRADRSDQAPSSFGKVIPPSAIQLLLGDDRAFLSDPPSLEERSGTFVVWRGDTAVSDPTSFGG
ncbi:hypothetical protein E6C27_scaffold126G00600 [Cucumis melo var. makuwa]|uniref:Uncharacterized protein n=1 Tax=Cucumis melo var. makuwa TaxID=1194695 RepID=A0A5A7USN8_CUCMM|nr:hypothetical protein E6C27_scaffold126G00600 [Cucumis melo var. makuwa]